jgi:hypothetical protein
MDEVKREAAQVDLDFIMRAIRNDLIESGYADAAKFIWDQYSASGVSSGAPSGREVREEGEATKQKGDIQEQVMGQEQGLAEEEWREREHEKDIAQKKKDEKDYQAKLLKEKMEKEVQQEGGSATEIPEGRRTLSSISAAMYDPAEMQKQQQNLAALTNYVKPNMSAEESARWDEWTQWANGVIQKPAVQQQPATPVQPSVAPGVTSMFNSPENIKRIADLLSRADSGQPVMEVMEEIRKSTGMDDATFWSSIRDLGKTAGENPFAEKEEDDDKGEGKDGPEKEDKKDDKKAPPFAKKEDKGEKSDESKDEGPEKPEPSKDEGEKDEEPKKSKSEVKREKKKEKDEAKLLKQMIGLGEKLLKLEKGEDDAHIEELKHAIEVLKEFNKEEKAEEPGAPEGDMDVIEKTGPDIPPALEGLALPMSEQVIPDAGLGAPGEMKVVDLAPPVMELAAAKKPSKFPDFLKKQKPGDDKDKGDDKGFIPGKAPEKKSEFQLHDRVWRKADFESGFETVGDEPGRIVDFGNGKAIVDWGNEGIPTEEEPTDLVLAEAAAVDSSMFALAKQSPWLESVSISRSPMGGVEQLNNVLRETSLHDILARQAKENETEPDTVKHIASGKTGKVLARMASGQLRISIDGKELVLWQCEVA